MYRNIKTIIHKNHKLYEYFSDISSKSNNLYNATLFRMRQVLTAVNKDPDQLTSNERKVLDEISNALPEMRKRCGTEEIRNSFVMPTKEKSFLSYYYLESLLYVTKNPDYIDEKFPAQTAQHVIKNAVSNMKGFYASCKDYSKHPGKYKGKPKLPKYHEANGKCSFKFSNQECCIKRNSKKGYLKFPKTKRKLEIGKYISPEWKLKEVKVEVYHDIFIVHITMDDMMKAEDLSEKESKRICAIDLGVNNFAAITNNQGLPCLLFKGGAIKSANHRYNKLYAEIQRKQTKGTTNKFVPTKRSIQLAIKRDNYIDDFMHKTAKLIVRWCKENDIDTVVIGKNKNWKQKCNIGGKSGKKVNTQNFVQIPFNKFQNIMRYLCERNGIKYIETEESYTSKASHVHEDYIPTIGEVDADKVTYSGKRENRMYWISETEYVNADLNGSANIGRKEFPKYTCKNLQNPDVIIIKHPDKRPDRLFVK